MGAQQESAMHIHDSPLLRLVILIGLVFRLKDKQNSTKGVRPQWYFFQK